MKKVVLALLVLLMSLFLMACGSKKENTKEVIEEKAPKKVEVEKEQETKEQTQESPVQEDSADFSNPVNSQPFKEYAAIFPKFVDKKYMPRCADYFLGNPYEEGEVCRLQISTACEGETIIKIKLEKLKVKISNKEDYTNTTTDGDGNYVNNSEVTTYWQYDDSEYPSVTTNPDKNAADDWSSSLSADQSIRNVYSGIPANSFVECYVDYYMFDENSDEDAGVWRTGVSTPYMKSYTIINTVNEHDPIRDIKYYSFEEMYGEGKYLNIDVTNLADDIITIDTNIEQFAYANGQEFKADWEFRNGCYDDNGDIILRYDLETDGFYLDDSYDRARFYDSLL